jgi:two-component system, response regulator PdtaR
MSGAPQDGIHRTRVVLVVEDELFIAMELQAALTEAGFRVMGPAGSVRDALHLIGKERPDAAILDVNLGREKVTPVAVRLNELRIPFVLASASDASELARYEGLAGALNLGKPTDLERLIAAVRSL